MERLNKIGTLAVAFIVACLLSTVVRTSMIVLSETLGTVWPFSLVHCHAASAPGCRVTDRPRPMVAHTSYGAYLR